MVEQDLKRIVSVLAADKKYLHLGKRVKKDFEDSNTKGIPVAMQVFFLKNGSDDVGFGVIAISPLKMKSWQKIFIEEGWVEKEFKTEIASFELMYLYIKPEFRRQGKGKILFNRVIKYAQKTGIKSIYAYVSDTNSYALNFYLKEKAKMISNFSEEGNITAFLVWDNISIS